MNTELACEISHRVKRFYKFTNQRNENPSYSGEKTNIRKSEFFNGYIAIQK